MSSELEILVLVLECSHIIIILTLYCESKSEVHAYVHT